MDVQLVENVQNLHGKSPQECCKGLEIDKDDCQRRFSVSERHSVSATTISTQTAHNP